MTVSCTVLASTRISGCLTSNKRFKCDNSTLPQGILSPGNTVTFPVSWNTQSTIQDAQNVSYGKVIPGIESTVLDIYTANQVAGYSSDIPVGLSGVIVSSDPFLFATPNEVDFGGLVLGSPSAANGLGGSFSLQNIGNSTLTLTGMAWGLSNTSGIYTNVTHDGQAADLGLGFTSPDFPAVGSTLAPGQALGIPLAFHTADSGHFSVSLYIWSDGGVVDVLLAAAAGNAPMATIAVSTLEGGWDASVPVRMAFGNVAAGSTVVRKMQICNTGGSVLSITKSKPPASPQLAAVSPFGEFLEGQKIDVGACATASVAVYAAPVQPNHPAQSLSLVWVLNTDGLDALNPTQPFGVHEVQIDTTIVSRQTGPVLADGNARFQWVGCFADTKYGRNLQNQIFNNTQQLNNTNGNCK